jgi:hypothetical protein
MAVTNRYETLGGVEKVNFLCDTLKSQSRQPKESEKGFTGMISKGIRILMLTLS